MNPAAISSAYGLWPLVILNSAIFILFAFSFFRPKSRRDWRTLGGFSAFVVALFVEMYGFPLTIYLLSGWLVKVVPGINLFSHDSGHLWETVLGMKGDPHLNPLHLVSGLFIFGGFILLASAWRVLFDAQKRKVLARVGPYRYIRHPQYSGFIMIMIGFLLEWPTLVTAVMFPVLVLLYVRLAHKEEREITQEFGETWQHYARQTPRWMPRIRALPHEPTVNQS